MKKLTFTDRYGILRTFHIPSSSDVQTSAVDVEVYNISVFSDSSGSIAPIERLEVSEDKLYPVISDLLKKWNRITIEKL